MISGKAVAMTTLRLGKSLACPNRSRSVSNLVLTSHLSPLQIGTRRANLCPNWYPLCPSCARLQVQPPAPTSRGGLGSVELANTLPVLGKSSNHVERDRYRHNESLPPWWSWCH